MSAGAWRSRPVWIGLVAVFGVLAGVVALALWTRPERDSVRVYTELLAAANREDVEAAARLCSARYRAEHKLRPAAEGGIVGLPRNIHPNFKAWRHGANVWLCPTNRVGPVYQFVFEKEGWRFDGPVGVLMSGGRLVTETAPLPES
jgi:hypothetical protein